MRKFAFIIHPIDAKRDVARKYPIARFLPERTIEWYLQSMGPIKTAHVTGIRSITGEEAEGVFIGCPLTPRQFLELPLDFIYDKLEQCGKVAEELGAEIVGLGAFTSVVGDGGITLSKRLNIPVTTGNSYTIATAIEGANKAADMMGIDRQDATVAIIGATGSIGATCAQLMVRDTKRMTLIGRNVERLEKLMTKLRAESNARLTIHTDIEEGLREADIIITVSSAAQAIIEPHHIKTGAVVCDVARPRDVSVAVSKERDDVLVIEGGVVQPPGEMRCTKWKGNGEFSFGFPPGTAYACMSETMALALDNRLESFTLGKDVSVRQVDEIRDICDRHGFRLAGFRSFERAVDDETIERIKRNAQAKRKLAPERLK